MFNSIFFYQLNNCPPDNILIICWEYITDFILGRASLATGTVIFGKMKTFMSVIILPCFTEHGIYFIEGFENYSNSRSKVKQDKTASLNKNKKVQYQVFMSPDMKKKTNINLILFADWLVRHLLKCKLKYFPGHFSTFHTVKYSIAKLSFSVEIYCPYLWHESPAE